MNSQPETPLAFPRTGEGFGNPRYDEPGMTLRDYFAGQAIPAVLTSAFDAADNRLMAANLISATAASVAYEIADAMLAERAKGGEA